jgi:hypothetical protein
LPVAAPHLLLVQLTLERKVDGLDPQSGSLSPVAEMADPVFDEIDIDQMQGRISVRQPGCWVQDVTQGRGSEVGEPSSRVTTAAESTTT